MIELYYWTTPNGHKITIYLEETALPYKIIPVNISMGDQFKPEFLAISPNNRIPAVIDHDQRAVALPSRCSSPAPFYFIWPRRLGNCCRLTCAHDTTPFSGSSGKWAGLARWLGRTTISANTRRRNSLMRSTAT